MESQPRFSPARREFLGAAAAALFAGITVTLIGCGDEATGPKAEPGDMVGQIDKNHGHSAIIKKAVLEAGGALDLDIKGSAGHTHTVSLSADEMTTLKNGGMVTKTSSTTDHAHSVMFMS